MSTGEHVVIICDHPSLHRGFSVVGASVAAHLHGTAGIRVTFLGRYPPDPRWRGPGYVVRDLHREEHPGARAQLHRPLAAELAACVARDRGRERSTVLCIGTLPDLIAGSAAVAESGIRAQVRLLGYLPVDCGPLPVQFADIAGRFDVLVPYSAFARTLMQDCFRRARAPGARLHSPIAHGVDTRTFAPPTPGRRRGVRRRFFDVGDDTFVVGYFGRNSGHKRPDLVLRLFQLFVSGAYGLCERCGAASGDALTPAGGPGRAAPRCWACDASPLARGTPHRDSLLYLHTDLQPDVRARRLPGARDLEHIAERYGISPWVRFDSRLRIGSGVPAEELAARMGACDVHVLPYVCAGWELTVLETGACGVPNLITDIASPPGYAAPFSRVIPVGLDLIETDLRGLIDIDLALRALLELAGSRAERERLGAAGVAVARELDWRRVGAHWVKLVRS